MNPHEPEQLNMPEVSEEYTLEDILKEFGSEDTADHGKQDPPPVKRHPSPAKEDPSPSKLSISGDTISFTPIRSAPKPPPTDAPVKIATLKSRDTVPFPLPGSGLVFSPEPLPKEPISPEPLEEMPPEAEKPQEPAKEKEKIKVLEPQTPQALFEKYRRGSVAQILRCAALTVLALLGLYALLCFSGIAKLPFFSSKYWIFASQVTLFLAMLLSYEVFVRGVMDVISRRFSLYTLSIPLCLLACVHALRLGSPAEDNFCPVVILLLAYLQYSLRLQRSAHIHSLHTVCGFRSPLGIFDAPQTSTKNDSLRCATANIGDYLQNLQMPDPPKRIFGIYAFVLLFLTPPAAYLLSVYSSRDFVLCWLLLLLCSIPWGAMLSYNKPFRALSRRLSKLGSALSGWCSARTFGKKHTIILRDEDLFPRSGISSNGMKLYGGYDASYVIANTLAILDAAESPLADLFETLLRSHNASRLYATNYRFYDNNGIGGEVLGEDILVGSLSFMQSMGVHMSAGARVRQAVYIAIHGELVGVFAIKYKANLSSRNGLRDIIANRNFTVVIAARDFLISPELIAAKYELPTDSLIFPAYYNRVRLSEIDPNRPTVQGALLAEDTFGAFSSTVAAGRILKTATLLSTVLSLIAGIGGLLLCSLFLFRDAALLLTPLYVAAFQLIWTLLSGLMTDIALKF